ncbi:anoctamin-1-like [Hetaerina americana]|uniref:anoctamin-1-like n=1 Tax=Hetaerina americana TaxID=62018 RepID=UPI003A7F557C
MSDQEEEIQMVNYPRFSNEEDDNFEDISQYPIGNGQQGTSMLNPRCNRSLYFSDGIRSVDFVLVWSIHGYESENTTLAQLTANADKRAIFENNLILEGLELEPAFEESSTFGLCFMKIHAPKNVLRRYSEILKLRMPMKEVPKNDIKIGRRNPFHTATMYLTDKIPGLHEVQEKTKSITGGIDTLSNYLKSKFKVDPEIFPPMPQRFTAIYSRDKEYLFDTDSEGFFSPSIRSRIVQFILDRKIFSAKKSDPYAFGIRRLISEGAYTAAYPLHDGDFRSPVSWRHTLYKEWASVKNCLQYQPLDHIKEYFGVKIALYFAWLGFYTHMLIPASIVGLACFIYSCCTLNSHGPSEDICNKKLEIKMCPLCDYFCSYWDLEETCLHSRVTYLFDNPSTVFFAIFMSFWAAAFLESWKRYSAEITHRWDLTGFDVQEEHPRPEYLARLGNVTKKQINIITNTEEPYVPFWRMRLPATILSFSVVILLVAIAVAAVLGVVLYRMSVLAALSVYGENVITSYAILFTVCTAATINLGCIMVFNWIYGWLAEYLTELELQRTQTEFDDSLTLKIYLLQFVNYYASIFYIAFLKGKSVGYPGKYNRLFGFRQEECGPGGCLLELCIQLSIIMIGKQAMNTLMEMVFPLVMKWINTIRIRKRSSPSGSWRAKGRRSAYQWMRDYKLNPWDTRSLFPEYLEMVLQYGFVTIFVAAFPLAPLCALLNNVLEMRLDAKKLLRYFQRPVTQRVKDIGIWLGILDSISKLAVVTNGFIIAFTSNFIPKLVYAFHVSEDHSLNGYLNFSLSYFNVSDLEPGSAPKDGTNVTMCRYPDFREPPSSENKYDKSAMYWHILAARLAFVVVFENVVVLVMLLVHWIIPDVPKSLRDRIRREAYLTNEIIIRRETERALASGGTYETGDGTPWTPLPEDGSETSDRSLLLLPPSKARKRKNSKKGKEANDIPTSV